MMIASDWLGLALLLSAFAWMAGRRFAALSLPLAVGVAALAVYLPTGTPRLTSIPKGHYTVLGARIDVDVAIYALLDDGKGEPRYFKLPYSPASANALQQALDTAGGTSGGGVHADVGEDGGVAYDGDSPVSGGAPKQAEQPSLQIP